MNIPDDVIETMARAAKAEIGRQFDARPLLGDTASDDWSATGGTLDLTALVRAALSALSDSGWVVVPLEIDAKTLADVLQIAREKPTRADKEVGASAALLAGASDGQMQIAIEIGSEMARDYRYIVARYIPVLPTKDTSHG